jgi:hypothetical protein
VARDGTPASAPCSHSVLSRIVIPYYFHARASLMTHKYRRCIVVLLINKSIEPNEEQKALTNGFDQGFTVNTSNGFSGVFGNTSK